MSEIQYAGFWLRFVAYIIDYFIIAAIQSIVVLPVLAILGFGFVSMDNVNFSDEDAVVAILGMMGALGTLILISAILGIIYFTAMEASKFQGTLGKMALGLKVTDRQGEPVDFGRALIRNLAKILSQMIFMIGFLMAGFTEQKQALHDIIAGALVIRK